MTAPYSGQVVYFQGSDGSEVPAIVTRVYPWTFGRPVPCDLFTFGVFGFGTRILSDDSDEPAPNTWHTNSLDSNSYGPFTNYNVIDSASGPVEVLLPPGPKPALYTNRGALSEVEFLLPSAWAGQAVNFYVKSAAGMRITAAVGATIRVGGSVGGSVESLLQGSILELVAVETSEWVARISEGQWST